MSSALPASNPEQPKTSKRAGGAEQAVLALGSNVTSLTPVWVDLASASELDGLGSRAIGRVGRTSVLVVRTTLGISAMADSCSHCGGALHAGSIDGDWVRCPEHSGVFDLLDGAVLAGPKTQPLAMFELRTVAGRIQVRRPHD